MYFYNSWSNTKKMEKENVIIPQLDMQKLQDEANKFAMQGAVKSIEEFYSGYNSPYRKALEEKLIKTEIGANFDLPNIIAAINDSLSKEIDAIANTAISKTFIPLVHKFLTREKKEINFSDVLKEFIEATDSKDMDDCSVEIVKNDRHDWLDLTLYGCKEKQYRLTLHSDYRSRQEQVKKYQFLSLPNNYNDYKQTMKLSIEGGTLELPFTRDILHDDFVSYIARLIMAGSLITMDCTDFNEDMFPREDECHCN